MRIALLAALCAGAMSYGPAVAGDFPSKSTYLYFVNGEPAGKTDITMTTEDGRYVFTSDFRVHTGEESHSLSCRTEFDKNTLHPLLFQYEGDRNSHSMSGNLTFAPDSVRAVQEVSGRSTRKRIAWADSLVIFQNYVTEHLAVLARRLSESGKAYDRFVVLFPTEMMSTPALATAESEVELVDRPTPVVCKKYVVSLQNSFPFYMYIESKHNALIYLEFPANRTEVFLQSVFGDHPQVRYTAPPEPDTEK